MRAETVILCLYTRFLKFYITTTRGFLMTKYLYALLAASALFLVGCQDKGPAQEAGEAVDDAVSEMQDALSGQGPAEDAGEKLDEWTEGN